MTSSKGVVAVVIAVGGQAARRPCCTELNSAVELAVDARRQAADHHALAFLAREHEVVHVGRRADGAVDGAVELDVLGLANVVVRLLLRDFFRSPTTKARGLLTPHLTRRTSWMPSGVLAGR